MLDVDLRVVALRTFAGTVGVPAELPGLEQPDRQQHTPAPTTNHLTVGVAYDTDLRTAQRVLVTAVSQAAHVAPSPTPQAWVEQFGESSIDFAVHCWHPADIASAWQARSSAAMAIKAALDTAGSPSRSPSEHCGSARSQETRRGPTAISEARPASKRPRGQERISLPATQASATRPGDVPPGGRVEVF